MNLSLLEKKINYAFENKSLLLQALTHSSYAYESQEEDIGDNEVLEFLGDSVLGLIVADFLFSAHPGLSEGELSKLKSSVANTSSLSSLALKIKLDKAVRLGKGEERSGGRKKKTILAGTFEALVAAMYLDGGFEAAQKFLHEHLVSFFKKIKINGFFINNYKSALQEYLQKDNMPSPIYQTLATKGPDHKKIFEVEVISGGEPLAAAKGKSKKEAEKKAAQKALKKLLRAKFKTLTYDTLLMKKKT